METPRFEPDESQPLATGPDSLPPRTARRLYKAASQGQLGKAWRQLRAPPRRRRGLWRTHRLVCLDKGGGAIRPILIGMIWAKLLSHLLLLPAKSDLEPFLKHRQFGIGTPQGGLAMTTAIKAHLAQHPDHVVACLDFKNAFGSINRTTCVKALRELCPHHPAWLDTVNVLLSEPVLVVNPAHDL